MKRVLLFFAVVLLCAPVYAESIDYGKVYSPKPGMSADEIMRIHYHNKYSLFAQDVLKTGIFLLVDSSGFTRKREWLRERIIKKGEDGISYKDMNTVTYPTDIKGLSILTWNYEDPNKEQEVWLWIPSLKKVRKVSASENDDAFLGSDFTVQEVSTRRFEDETYVLLGEEDFKGYTFKQTNEVKAKGTPCFVIECTPRAARWYYAKRKVWVDKEMGGVIFEEYYNKKGVVFKTIFREWALLPSGNNQYPSEVALECKDLRTNHRTVVLMDMNNQKYDQNMNEQRFTVKRLMRSRW